MGLIHVVGIGLDGKEGLPDATQKIIQQATLLVGSSRHLSYFSNPVAETLVLGDLQETIHSIGDRLQPPSSMVVILVSGDPLFFGLGRLLLESFPPAQLTFHPHLSSIQLAFSRVKVPWHDATLISAHGRSPDLLIRAVQNGADKIAILTDPTHTPAAIARLVLALDLPTTYRCWVCENLGSADERVRSFSLQETTHCEFSALNVVILLRQAIPQTSTDWPVIGIPDSAFHSFSDRPGLMTKREIRLLVLGELALQSAQTVWDIGAGTGSVSIELARLVPTAAFYAIEKTAAGIVLIQQNQERFQTPAVHPIHGAAPAALVSLPDPDRVFIGGSGGNLTAILDTCGDRLRNNGRIVLAIATVEHLTETLTWVNNKKQSEKPWQYHLLQVNISRSVPIANLTRQVPLNPVTLVTLTKSALAIA